MKLRSFVYLFTILCLTAGISFTQSVSSEKTKETAASIDPAGLIDNKTLIKIRIKVVYDGDTVGVEGKDKKMYPIRLQGVDAREKGQDYGGLSRKSPAKLVEDRVVLIIVNEKTISNQYIGRIYLDGDDIGLKQIEAGKAWHFKKYNYAQPAEDRKRFSQAEVKARIDRVGLWEDKAPIPPWEYAGDEAIEPKIASPVTLAGMTPVENKPENKKVEPTTKPAAPQG